MNRAMPLIATHSLRARWRWRFLRGPRLVRYRERQARRIVAFARDHSPFYADHWSGHDPADWRALPAVDKGLMMAHFDRFNTRGVERQRAEEVALAAERGRDFRPTIDGLTVGLSSGTSGHRGLFLVSPWESAAWAGTILARTLVPRREPTRVAFFLRANSNLYEGLGSRLLRFRFFDLMTPLADAVSALNAFAPHYLVGPPSLLGFLAGAQQGGKLHIRPDRLLSVAETLEPQDSERLREVFGAPVGQIYQCTEGLLAISCPHGSLHVQEDLVALQYERLAMDEDRPGDDPLRITPIVTDLWRRTQPIIRYRLNDVLRLAPVWQTCRCGSPFQIIEAVEGRQDDVCQFIDSAGTLRPIFPDTIRRGILLASPAILDYRAVQEHPGDLCITLDLPVGVAFAPVAAAVRASIERTLQSYGCRAAELIIAEGIRAAEAGVKRRRVQRLSPR